MLARSRWAAGPMPITVRARRLGSNPIITRSMLPRNDGENINGPSLIRVPSWIKGRLGKYYLYFAHHKGSYIRLAYADDLNGPWNIYEPGTLKVEETHCAEIRNPARTSDRHIASPDVHVDHAMQDIRMYFHGPVDLSGDPARKDSYAQRSFVAKSKDGVNFRAQAQSLGNPYFRVFQWEGAYYSIAMPGVIYRSTDGIRDFVEGPTLFMTDMRHSGVTVHGDRLLVFYSIVGERPERIVLSTVDLSRPWTKWQATAPTSVLEPETDWEGGTLELKRSVRGLARGPVRELRDPAIFADGGKHYLLYSVAGESGIGIAELLISCPNRMAGTDLIGREESVE